MQIRTEIEELWANLTERCAALVDPELKYGGGPQEFREFLDGMSELGHQLDISSEDVQSMRDLVGPDALGRASNSGGPARSQPAREMLEVEEVLRRALDGFRRICDDFPSRLGRTAMKYFVLTYDRTTDQVAVEPFDDDASAFAELERATLAKRPTDEVVLFYADSVDALKRTHSRYFFTEREMIDATLAALSA